MVKRDESIPVRGMHCTGCETQLEEALKRLAGVTGVGADRNAGRVLIGFEADTTPLSQILAVIEACGYEPTFGPPTPPSASIQLDWLPRALKIMALVVVIGGVVAWGRSLMPGLMARLMEPETGYSMILLVGFLTGFHCIGMCGSFVVAYATAPSRTGKARQLQGHLGYGAGKTLSYAGLGAGFGALGALVTFTPFLRGALAVVAGVFLILYGLRMLNLLVGPAWLNWVFPRFVTRRVQSGMRDQPKPLRIGLLNGFLLGCGPLQAMYIMAAGTGSPLRGALSLACFSLGTLGPLLTFGWFARLLSRRVMNELVRVSGALVLIMGLLMLNNGLRMTESGFDAMALKERWQQWILQLRQGGGGDAPCH